MLGCILIGKLSIATITKNVGFKVIFEADRAPTMGYGWVAWLANT